MIVEEIKEYNNLKKIEHHLMCPKCHIEMEGITVLTTYPPKYEYICRECGQQIIASRNYPYTEIAGEPICTYQEVGI